MIRIVEIGVRPDGLEVRVDARAGRTVVELAGVIVGWYSAPRLNREGELVVDWHALDEALLQHFTGLRATTED